MRDSINVYVIKSNGCNLFYKDLREAMNNIETVRKHLGEIEFFYKLGIVSNICPVCGSEIQKSCKCQGKKEL